MDSDFFLLLLTLLGVLFAFIFHYEGLTAIPAVLPPSPIRGAQVAIVFSLVFGGQILVLYSLFNLFPSSSFATYIAAVSAGIILFAYFMTLSLNERKFLFGEKKKVFSDIGFGLLFFLLAYPVTTVTGNMVARALTLLGYSQGEQIPILALEAAKDAHLEFIFLIFLVVIFIPAIEELLFRRFFLSWAARYFTPTKSNLITSIFFVFMHVQEKSGLRNFEWGSALLILSYYLGIVSMKRQSLAAPWALHAAFNGFNIFLLTLIG